MATTTCEYCDVPRLDSEDAHDPIDCIDTLRTTLARLTADLAAVTAERDMWRGECASISAELDLPPGMRPMDGELRRMLGHNRALLAERDEARGMLDASDTTRREWEVRAARSYADGRAAGLREAAGVCMELGGNALSIAWVNAADECERRIRALAPPAAETVVARG